jgi:hypothetical protein
MVTLVIAGFKNEWLRTFLYSLHVSITGTGFTIRFLTVATAGTISSSYAHATISWIRLPDSIKHDNLSLLMAA